MIKPGYLNRLKRPHGDLLLTDELVPLGVLDLDRHASLEGLVRGVENDAVLVNILVKASISPNVTTMGEQRGYEPRG